MKNIFKKNDDAKKKVEKTKDEGAFGGMSKKNILSQLESGGQLKLTQQTVSEKARQALEQVKSLTTQTFVGDNLSEQMAQMYAEGSDQKVSDMLKKYIVDNKGAVDKKFWYMLLDIYHVTDQQPEFEKFSIMFARTFSCSSPSWPETHYNYQSDNMMQNIIVLQTLTEKEEKSLKEFVALAKKQKFCRIDVSKLKLESSNIESVEFFLHRLYELRKHKVLCVMLQESNVLDFCQQYMKRPHQKQPTKLKPEFLGHEKIFWLLYLEILQWKNRSEEFDDVALEYAELFEESPPGWDDAGVMRIESSLHQHMQESDVSKTITTANVQKFIDDIQARRHEDNITVDVQHIERFDEPGAGALLMFLQKFKETHDNRITFKYPNEFILSLFEQMGIDDFSVIVPRVR